MAVAIPYTAELNLRRLIRESVIDQVDSDPFDLRTLDEVRALVREILAEGPYIPEDQKIPGEDVLDAIEGVIQKFGLAMAGTSAATAGLAGLTIWAAPVAAGLGTISLFCATAAAGAAVLGVGINAYQSVSKFIEGRWEDGLYDLFEMLLAFGGLHPRLNGPITQMLPEIINAISDWIRNWWISKGDPPETANKKAEAVKASGTAAAARAKQTNGSTIKSTPGAIVKVNLEDIVCDIAKTEFQPYDREELIDALARNPRVPADLIYNLTTNTYSSMGATSSGEYLKDMLYAAYLKCRGGATATATPGQGGSKSSQAPQPQGRGSGTPTSGPAPARPPSPPPAPPAPPEPPDDPATTPIIPGYTFNPETGVISYEDQRGGTLILGSAMKMKRGDRVGFREVYFKKAVLDDFGGIADVFVTGPTGKTFKMTPEY